MYTNATLLFSPHWHPFGWTEATAFRYRMYTLVSLEACCGWRSGLVLESIESLKQGSQKNHILTVDLNHVHFGSSSFCILT